MIYLKRKSMKKYVVVYKRKKYIKVATAIGSKFYRILVVICLLFSCITMNEKQYSIVLESWKYFKFIMIDVKDNGKKE